MNKSYRLFMVLLITLQIGPFLVVAQDLSSPDDTLLILKSNTGYEVSEFIEEYNESEYEGSISHEVNEELHFEYYFDTPDSTLLKQGGYLKIYRILDLDPSLEIPEFSLRCSFPPNKFYAEFDLEKESMSGVFEEFDRFLKLSDYKALEEVLGRIGQSISDIDVDVVSFLMKVASEHRNISVLKEDEKLGELTVINASVSYDSVFYECDMLYVKSRDSEHMNQLISSLQTTFKTEPMNRSALLNHMVKNLQVKLPKVANRNQISDDPTINVYVKVGFIIVIGLLLISFFRKALKPRKIRNLE